MDKAIDYYMGLPYTIEMVPGLESGWVVSVRELPGCISQGDSPQNAVDMIREAMCGWLEIALEDGVPIPEPRELEEYSGKFVVRVPRWLHRELARTSGQEGVSLNQLVSTALARAVGERAALAAQPPAGVAAAIKLEAVRSALAALTTSLRQGDAMEATRLAGEMSLLLQADLPGGRPPAGRQQAAARRNRVQKGGPKSDMPLAGSPYIISRQPGALCLADGDAGQPAKEGSPQN